MDPYRKSGLMPFSALINARAGRGGGPSWSCGHTTVWSDAQRFATGLAWLAIGFLAYAVARPPTLVAGLLPFLPVGAPLPPRIALIFGPVPTFIHALAFSLMLSSIVSGDRAHRVLACGVWAGVEIALEVIQHPTIGRFLLQHSRLTSLVPYLHHYVAGGTFDFADIAAALFGAALAAWSLTATRGDCDV